MSTAAPGCARAPPPPVSAHLALSVDYLADLVFRQNPHDRGLELCLPELHGPADLFFFLLDLFCKGLVLLYGARDAGRPGRMRLPLETLDAEQLAHVQKKLGNAGIQALCRVGPNARGLPTGASNMAALVAMAEAGAAQSLEQYGFWLVEGDRVLEIAFRVS
jgi:hypothetical protein